MVVANANMWRTWSTRHATNTHAQLIAKALGVPMARAIRSALTAATVVRRASSKAHSPSQLKHSMVARSVHTLMTKSGN